ncbi:MAG: hypothetical protein KDC13_06495 [Bacteroidetes bacterium]|nr:hypothetical protein [Bacteroidota bacterium]
MKRTIAALILLVYFLLSLSGEAATLCYKIMVDGEEHGRLTAICNRQSNEDYSLKLNTRLQFFLLNIESDIYVEFRNGMLLRAGFNKTINGVETENTEIVKHGNGLHLSGSDIDTRFISGNVAFSVGCLYHSEPKSKDTILSERLGEKVLVTRIADSKYMLHLPDGQTNTYTYKNGICTSMQTRNRGKSVVFILI